MGASYVRVKTFQKRGLRLSHVTAPQTRSNTVNVTCYLADSRSLPAAEAVGVIIVRIT